MQYAEFVKKHNLSDILSENINEEGDIVDNMVNDNTMDSQSDNNDEQHDIDEQSANDTTCAVRVDPNIEEEKEEGDNNIDSLPDNSTIDITANAQDILQVSNLENNNTAAEISATAQEILQVTIADNDDTNNQSSAIEVDDIVEQPPDEVITEEDDNKVEKQPCIDMSNNNEDDITPNAHNILQVSGVVNQTADTTNELPPPVGDQNEDIPTENEVKEDIPPLIESSTTNNTPNISMTMPDMSMIAQQTSIDDDATADSLMVAEVLQRRSYDEGIVAHQNEETTTDFPTQEATDNSNSKGAVKLDTFIENSNGREEELNALAAEPPPILEEDDDDGDTDTDGDTRYTDGERTLTTLTTLEATGDNTGCHDLTLSAINTCLSPVPDASRLPKNNNKQEWNDAQTDIFSDVGTELSEAQSEASMKVLWRYMGLSKRKYMSRVPSMKKKESNLDDEEVPYIHDLQVGDHVIRWKMLGYCYPIQVHGIVYSVGPEVVTIVDCGLDSYSDGEKVGMSFEDDDKKKSGKKKERRRMNILTLVDEKEISKWTKIKYGEEVELKVHSTNHEMQKHVQEKDIKGEDDVIIEEESDQKEDEGKDEEVNRSDEQESDADEEGTVVKEKEAISAEYKALDGLEMEEVEVLNQAKVDLSPDKPNPKRRSSSWFACKPKQNSPKKESERVRMPAADSPELVLARLRFLLEHGDKPCGDEDESHTLLPPHHLLYANSECIAVFCKTGRWSTLQAAIFLHSSTVGNAKQSATVTALLASKTATVPASGIWGFFGGTTTVSLFTAQPWLVPALVGGGAVYVGLPMLMLWKAKGHWAEAEKRLNNAFWSVYDADYAEER